MFSGKYFIGNVGNNIGQFSAILLAKAIGSVRAMLFFCMLI
jgi:hypothetical protein